MSFLEANHSSTGEAWGIQYREGCCCAGDTGFHKILSIRRKRLGVRVCLALCILCSAEVESLPSYPFREVKEDGSSSGGDGEDLGDSTKGEKKEKLRKFAGPLQAS